MARGLRRARRQARARSGRDGARPGRGQERDHRQRSWMVGGRVLRIREPKDIRGAWEVVNGRKSCPPPGMAMQGPWNDRAEPLE